MLYHYSSEALCIFASGHHIVDVDDAFRARKRNQIINCKNGTDAYKRIVLIFIEHYHRCVAYYTF